MQRGSSTPQIVVFRLSITEDLSIIFVSSLLADLQDMATQCTLRFHSRVGQVAARRSLSSNSSSRQISYVYGMPRKPLVYKTIPQVLREAADSWPDRDHIVSVHQSLRKTFSQLYEDTNRLAKALISMNVKKGDRVGIWAPNCYEWVVTHYAVSKVGGILVNVNPGYREKELTHCVNLVSMSTLISSQQLKSSNYVQLLESASPGIFESSSTGIGLTSATLPSLKNVIYINDCDNEIAPSSYTRFWQLIECNSASEPEINYKLNPEDIWNIQFTSGTTGSPKGAALTHHGTVNNAIFATLDYLHHFNVCVPNPLYHCFGSVAGLLAGALHNNTIVLPHSVSTAGETLKAIETFKCHATFGTPTMYVDLIREKKMQQAAASSEAEKCDLSSIEILYMSGSPCPEKLTRDMKNSLFPSLRRVIIPYGTTEVSPVITLTRPSPPDDNYDYTTVGTALDHSEVKIVDPKSGETLPRGEVGELWTRSVYVFPGYWNEKEKTAQVIDERAWYKTG